MRSVLVLLLGGACLAPAAAQQGQPGKRHGIEADRKTYPQDSPKEALASVLKAIDAKRIDYLLAHLADPKFVDGRVEAYGGKFEELLKETKAKLLDDPGAAKLLRQFLEKGEWKIEDDTASVRLKDVADRWGWFRKMDGRWFFENRKKPEGEGK